CSGACGLSPFRGRGFFLVARAQDAAHTRARFDPNPGSGKIALDTSKGADHDAVAGDPISLHPPLHCDVSGFDPTLDDARFGHKNSPVEVDGALYASPPFKVTAAVRVTESGTGFAYCRRHTSATLFTHCTSVSTWPRKLAPTAMVSRGERTFPVRRAPAKRSTRSFASILPATDPATLTRWPLTSELTDASGPSSTDAAESIRP